MRRLHTVFTIAMLLLMSNFADAKELVSVNIDIFAGDEPVNLSSNSHPSLFTLDPSIAFAEHTTTNPCSPIKNDNRPAT